MATPKTDIEQSVGRILREKHNNPIVVDIIDGHDLFQNQWRKRKTFYKKENYQILEISNFTYTPDTTKWKVLFSPNPNGPKPCKKNSKKTISIKSNSSTDKSITNDSDSEEEEEIKESKDKYLCGKCLLFTKK
jgi:superfamily II DNA or RNA helicase